ncbi:MAG: YeeE/YedE thiosulfate transporter family protein [Anaeromyxobacteraceae bacterium]
MTFPFDVLVHGGRELGLVVAVAIGFGFGFVLERSGFGRAQKLVAQFFGDDMTVFKVMFGAIVTAMLGAVVLSGLGLADLRAIADSATSATWLWPMIAGGFLLGVGFIVSGYCPGTSVVAAASGKLDGLATVVGVVAGTVVYGELMAWAPFAAFSDSGYLGHVYLYELLHLPPAVVALFVAAMAVACFVGAEKLEAIFSKGAASSPSGPRRLVFAGFGAVALAGVATLALPSATAAVAAPARIDPEALAHRVVEAPWNVRVLDLRAAEACGQARVPGAECAPAASLAELDLGFAPASRDLVLVADGDLAEVPAAARAYRGRVLVLEGGWEAWKTWALDREDAVQSMPAPGAPAADVAAYRFRNAVNAALTGVKVAPPPAPAAGGGMPAPKRKASGGGCSG